MTTLLLQLAGPLQSWGTGSRFAYRSTGPAPSKSAVIGLLAAALGKRRSEPIEDLLELRFGVRCDQPGRVVRDFQTARALDESYSLPLTYRFYLSDAVFVVGVEGRRELIEALAEALRRPAFPLFLGRRSCPPARPLVLGTTDQQLVPALESLPWQAAAWYRRTKPAQMELDLIVDAGPEHLANDTMQDEPLSFDPHHRRYALRGVHHGTCGVGNPDARDRHDGSESSVGGVRTASTRRPRQQTSHDPMAWWETR
ncbi:CRISPR system Cascade subunit CasD [Salana multivorans]|uniref:CRISPR system Cascade subunit CasD n=1 Tax=Salana multivorans TaxID=120377 RepID=A0A3N2DAV4_9MICO|nr:type I-E CRISPR-associated protein Cas5/CasD [Salana multivorans]ROR96935.1 CRISPR system Cascade subunit CasD [Salana multivorans]